MSKSRKTADEQQMLEQETIDEQEQKAPDEQEAQEASQSPGEQPAETVRVVFLSNTKHNRTLYRAGQKIGVPPEDYDVLLRAGVIQLIEE